MAKPVFMPRVGQSVESSLISAWHKKVGDPVAVGDRLFTFETDKATFEEEAKDSGVFLAKFFEEGDDVPCMLNVCVIGQPGESFEEFRPNAAGDKKPAVVEETKKEETTVAADAATPSDGLYRISPRARALADKKGVDYRLASPTGPEGRIVEKDIQALIDSGVKFTSAALQMAQTMPGAAGVAGTGIGGRVTVQDLAAASIPAAEAAKAAETAGEMPAYEDVKLTNIRKVIARSMQQSLSSMAQLTNHSGFDATVVEKLRQDIKENGEALGLGKITLNDMILYAVSRTLSRHKDLNAHFLDDRIRYFKDVHLGMAVDTDRGLMVPTIFYANKKSLSQISEEAKDLVQKCRNGSISPDYLSGATFTVSNLGPTGIEMFTPIINPPQTAILGVCSIVQRARQAKDGGVEFYPCAGLSLTYDHRAVDGAPAARFAQDLAKNLENFLVLLAK
ncbi:MAG: dihydrolipoamide acetyltransferase family protein [Christensenellales bacterium]